MRFFRHLILAVRGILIVVPIAICIFLTADNRKLSAEILRLEKEKRGMEQELEELRVQISELAQAESLDEEQQKTQEARWLAKHCAEYGFILRYPKDKTDITGIDYESWHFRYVGEEAAAYIMENGITLEEFLETVDKL